MMRTISWLTLLFLLFSAGGGTALAAGDKVSYPSAPIDRSDLPSLQRGAAIFVNYCMGCHSAEYMRYGRLAEDLGISEAQIKDKLVYTDSSLAEGMKTAMTQEDAQQWFHQAKPPDLSLSAKLRGTDWLYAYLHGFYIDESRPSGWNNSVFPNVAMPHVLADLQGEIVVDSDGNSTVVRQGRLTALDYDLQVIDLVNFMDYLSDPGRPARHRAGYLILSFLLVLLILTYFLYRNYWEDVK